MRLILASGSPRRRELLEARDLSFEVIVSPAEEIHDPRLGLAGLCEKNAELKAAAVASSEPDAIVIAADTLVWIDGVALGKPRDLDEAGEMLRMLGGRTHEVCTGVCVIFPDGRIERFHDITTVTFQPLGEERIADYFQKVNPLDKAGAYGIQEHGELLVEGIQGEFDNVMGLPVKKLLAVLDHPPGSRAR